MSLSTRFAFAISLTLGLVLGPACDKGEDSSEGGDKAAEKSKGGGKDAPGDGEVGKDAKDDAKDEVDAKKDDGKDEDKGTATLKLGDDDTEWKAKRASARIKDGGKLRITASVYNQDDETASRQALTLLIKDFKGPGSYEADPFNSNLTSVSLNLKGMKKADADKDKDKADAAAKKAAMDGIRGGSVSLLKGAKIEITNVTDDFIDGTLTWSGVAYKGPNKIAGDFHARIKD
jgi:hypothetical protein